MLVAAMGFAAAFGAVSAAAPCRLVSQPIVAFGGEGCCSLGPFSECDYIYYEVLKNGECGGDCPPDSACAATAFNWQVVYVYTICEGSCLLSSCHWVYSQSYYGYVTVGCSCITDQ